MPISEAKAILSKLVSFDTTSARSNLELIHFIAGYLESLGAKPHIVYNCEDTAGENPPKVKKAGLICHLAGDPSCGVMLSGHTDVVPTTGQEWSFDPYALTDEGDKLYGRGTADMKGFIACALASAENYMKHETPVTLVFSYDEEIGCLSASPLAAELKALGIHPRFAIIGEPTGMKVVTAHKGIISFFTHITGLEGHSSAPEKGVNAVYIAAKLISFLESKQADVKSITDSRFDPPYTTFNVGTVNGGTANNIIPRECVFSWEIRPVPGFDAPAFIEEYESLCRSLESEMRAIYPECKIENRPRSSVSGLNPDKLQEILGEVLLLASSNSTHTAAFGTEAGIFQSCGIPSFVCGPGHIEQAHKTDEFIETAQLKLCLEMLGRIRP